MGSSSCHYDDELTQWGEYLQNFLTDLLHYGVEEHYIENQSASDLLTALLLPEYAENIALINKHVPSSYGNRILSSRKQAARGLCFGLILVALFLFVITHEVYI